MKPLTTNDMKKQPYIKRIREELDNVLVNGRLTEEGVDKLLNTREIFFNIWGLSYQNVKDVDFSKLSPDYINKIPFSSSTVFDEKKLPEFFKPEAILKDNKKSVFRDINVDDSDVCMAIIDNPSQFYLHEEFAGIMAKLVDFSAKDDQTHFHTDGVLSNVCGVNLGFAKKAKFIVYTIEWAKRAESHMKALEDILKRIKGGQKIQVVSISNQLVEAKIKGSILEQKIMKTVSKLKEFNCEVVDSSKFLQSGFAGTYCPILQDIDDIDSWLYSFGIPNGLGVQTTKLTPEFGSKNGYSTKYLGGISWAIPIVSFFYALCSSRDDSMNFDNFAKSCEKHTVTNKNGVRIVNFKDMLK